MISELLDDKSIYGKVEADFKEALSSMKEFHSDWREYDAFFLADQWNSQRASWRPDPVINYVAYTVKQKKPQLTNSRPTGLIMPTAQGDEEAARLFTQVTDVIAERVDLDSRIEEVCGTGLLLDIAWFKVYWDTSISGGKKGKMTKWLGDVAIEAPDPANVYFDPNASRVQDCRYIIYAVPKPVKWIEEWARSIGKTVTIQPERTFETEVYDRPGKESGKDRAMLYEYWYKENGTINVIYAANGNVLKHIKNIYRHGQYPFIPFVAEKRRKSIVGISEVRNIMNNQKLLNKLVELPTTSALLTANPIALIQSGSGIDKNKWVSKPGMVWEVKDTTNAVKWLEPPSFQGDVYKLIDLMTQYIERIGGIYDANTGETPGAVTAAAAIQLLQEQGSIPIKGIARNLYASIKEVYEQMIELVKEFYTEDRVIRINGENGGYEFINFNAIKYADVDFDIKVSAGASTPTSKAYIAQLAADLFEKQLLLPSEYVEMQEGLPNKDRIIARLRQAEQAPPPMGQPMNQPQGQPMMQPSLDEIYAKSPPPLQREIDLMREQGMPDDQILQQLMRMLNTA